MQLPTLPDAGLGVLAMPAGLPAFGDGATGTVATPTPPPPIPAQLPWTDSPTPRLPAPLEPNWEPPPPAPPMPDDLLPEGPTSLAELSGSAMAVQGDDLLPPGATAVEVSPAPEPPEVALAPDPVVADPVVADPVVAEPVVAEPVVVAPFAAEAYPPPPQATVPDVPASVTTEPVIAEPVAPAAFAPPPPPPAPPAPASAVPAPASLEPVIAELSEPAAFTPPPIQPSPAAQVPVITESLSNEPMGSTAPSVAPDPLLPSPPSVAVQEPIAWPTHTPDAEPADSIVESADAPIFPPEDVPAQLSPEASAPGVAATEEFADPTPTDGNPTVETVTVHGSHTHTVESNPTSEPEPSVPDASPFAAPVANMSASVSPTRDGAASPVVDELSDEDLNGNPVEETPLAEVPDAVSTELAPVATEADSTEPPADLAEIIAVDPPEASTTPLAVPADPVTTAEQLALDGHADGFADAQPAVSDPTPLEALPEPEGDRITVYVVGMVKLCYSCGEPTRVISGVLINAPQPGADDGNPNVVRKRRKVNIDQTPKFRYVPFQVVAEILVEVLDADWYDRHEVGPLAIREMTEEYRWSGDIAALSNGCSHCDAMLRDYPIQDAFEEAVGNFREYSRFAFATVVLPLASLPAGIFHSTGESALASGLAQ